MPIGVVTPTFNGAAHLAETIDSVQRQTEPAAVHLVVDDGSTDGSGEIVRALAHRYPNLRLVRQENRGLSAARNRGLEALPDEVDLVLFLDDDDLLRPRALVDLRTTLAADPDAPAAHGRVAAIDGAGNEVPLVRGEAAARRRIDRPGRWWTPRGAAHELPEDVSSDFASLAYVLYIYSVGQVLVRRPAIEAVGGFDEVLSVAQDLELWLRLAAQAPLAFHPSIVLDYRQAGPSLSSDQSRTRREDLHVRSLLMADPTVPSAIRRVARDVHRHHEWHRASDRAESAVAAARARDTRTAMRELMRAGRSVGEAIVALVPGDAVPRRRTARFVRRSGR